MKKSIGKTLSYARKNFTKQSGQLINNVSKSSRVIGKDISKAINNISFESMTKDARRTSRFAIKRSSRAFNRGVKNFKRSGFYKSVSGFPKLTTAFSLWSLVQFRKFKRSINKGYYSSRKWVLKTYPKVESYAVKKNSALKSWMSVQLPLVGNFIQQNYPKVENFVLTNLPVYRAIMGR
jgi:hypothetical protein